jgi:hypothetical protein
MNDEADAAMTWPLDYEWFEKRMQRPHKYAQDCNPNYPGTCWGCGKPKDDPIHRVEEPV